MPWNVWNVSLARWENLTSFKTKGLATLFRDEVVIPEEREGGPFEVRKTGDVLEEHGTKLMQLKPSTIWGAAMADLERRARNSETGATLAGVNRPVTPKHYAFHRKHVLNATTANDIIRAAIAEPGIGLASGKKDTRLLYSDVELLKASLK